MNFSVTLFSTRFFDSLEAYFNFCCIYILFLSFCTVDFEVWHLQLITGLVVLISSSRYILLKTWPDFAESSKAANQQVSTVQTFSSTTTLASW